MKNDGVNERLNNWLETKGDINSKLLKKLTSNDLENVISLQDIDQIYPMLLIEFANNDLVDEALKNLKEELNRTKNNNYQIIYLKSKFSLISHTFILNELQAIQNFFSKVIFLKEKCNIDIAYQILFYVENAKKMGIELDVSLSQFLPALMVHCAKEYKLVEFSILVEAFSIVSNIFSEAFYFETLRFLIDQQSERGYFGFSDPFFVSNNSKKLDVTIHMYIAYRRLKKCKDS